MSELKSMKLAKKEREVDMAPSSLATERPAYPWGLGLMLSNEALAKLGVTMEDFTVGATMTLIAKVDVTAVSKNESEGQAPMENVSLQITAMCLEDGASKAATAAESLYGDK